MKTTTRSFLNLLFNPNESFCVSSDQYSYHSINQKDLNNIALISPNEKIKPKIITENDIELVAINPINGFRNDSNVTNYRSFLVEVDDLSLPDQLKYIKVMKMPYSVCVFSGNKSLHFGIVLKEDLTCEYIWRVINQWILNIMKKADQNTKNPSRCIRFPENQRKNGKQLIQKLVEIKERISQEELFIWLNKYEDLKPKNKFRVKSKPLRMINFNTLPKWIKNELTQGVYVNRSNTWFSIGCYLAQNTFESDDQAIEFLGHYFNEEKDFKEKEFINVIKSAYKICLKNEV